MKKLLLILAGIIITFIGMVTYYIDRIICAVLPWFEVLSFEEWKPKSIDMNDIKKQYGLEYEDLEDIQAHRKLTRYDNIKFSLIRIAVISTLILIFGLIF